MEKVKSISEIKQFLDGLKCIRQTGSTTACVNACKGNKDAVLVLHSLGFARQINKQYKIRAKGVKEYFGGKIFGVRDALVFDKVTVEYLLDQVIDYSDGLEQKLTEDSAYLICLSDALFNAEKRNDDLALKYAKVIYENLKLKDQIKTLTKNYSEFKDEKLD